MLIGIDVGGTYTDGVLFSGGSVIHTVKHLTDVDDLEGTLLFVLDELLAQSKTKNIQRVVLSTTLVTNLLATGQGERTALLLLPGSGLPFSAYQISPDTHFLRGSIDFRGRQIEAPDKKEIEKVLQEIDRACIQRVAVAGKFSNRNDRHEMLIKEMVQARYPHMDICTSNEISGQLNFPRRAVTCYYTAMTIREWNRFADEIETATGSRVPGCELHILKADGGTTTMEASRKRPCETVFSGPAASTMGSAALCRGPLNSVVVDIGGTTSDISLLIEGQPLYASKGALIRGHLTHIHSFAVNSIAMGGDSPVFQESGELRVGAVRLGAAACFGGETPTVIDAFNVLLDLNIGNPRASQTKLEAIAGLLGQSLEGLCRSVADRVIEALKESIQQMFCQWEDEPAYKVWEVVNRKRFILHQIIGIGAAAPAIVPMLARELGVKHFLHRYSPVANALGAAVARPTLAVQVHVDTQSRVYTVSPEGLSGAVEKNDYQMQDAKQLAQRFLKEIGRKRGLSAYADEAQVYLEEQFNVIRGSRLAGKIFDVGIQIAPGFIHGYEGVAQ
jgi:N-methylhydantoinase A/oxoprolinase/acetone carboxylase beta subunit